MKTAYFPLFVDIKNKPVLIIGGGKIAERRIKVLTPFAPNITVISPAASEYIADASLRGNIRLICRKYQGGDIAEINPFLLIAAADDREVNHAAAFEAKALNIHVSVASCQTECSCYFPAIAESKDYLTAIVSKNGNHSGVKLLAQKIRELLKT